MEDKSDGGEKREDITTVLDMKLAVLTQARM